MRVRLSSVTRQPHIAWDLGIETRGEGEIGIETLTDDEKEKFLFVVEKCEKSDEKLFICDDDDGEMRANFSIVKARMTATWFDDDIH